MKKLLTRLSDWFDTNKMMQAVRHALILTMPVLMIGSFAELFRELPIPAYQDFIQNMLGGYIHDFLTLIMGCCFEYFSCYVIVCVSLCYMMEYSERVEDYIITPIISIAGYLIMIDVGSDTYDPSALSLKGTFEALLMALFASWVYRKTLDTRLSRYLMRSGMRGGVLYQKALQAIFPMGIVFLSCATVNLLFGTLFDVHNISQLLAENATIIGSQMTNGYLSGLFYVIMVQLFWFLGMQGTDIMSGAEEQVFADIGQGIICSETFFNTFVHLGGCGAIIGLVIAILLRGKHRTNKRISKSAILPTIFNINELIIYGFPIVFNPIMLFPFVLIPVVIYHIAYIAFALNLVPAITQTVDYTMPLLASGYLTTGSVAGLILQAVCLVVSIVLYMPFIFFYERMTDRRLIGRVETLTEIMQQAEKEMTPIMLTERNDIYGGTARLMVEELKTAIRKREVYMMYQPQTNAKGECIGAEALLRWDHKDVGFIYPPLIIQLAKEGEVLGALERQIFDSACKAARMAIDHMGEEAKISLNLTGTSLARTSIIDELDSALKKYDVPPSCIWLEVTESEVLKDDEQVANTLLELKHRGHNLIIDDFSMGHTSLKYLKMDCFEGLKLDGAITRDVEGDRVGQEIIASLASLSKRLDVNLVAEYVEKESQMQRLQELGCDFYQGYLYSKPLRFDDFEDYLKK